MSVSSACVSPARSVVIWASFLLAMAGWGVALFECWSDGYQAGVDPVFIAALSVGIAFTVTCSQAVIMPDKVKLFGLGVAEGIRLANGVHERDPDPGREHHPRDRSRSHLSAVGD